MSGTTHMALPAMSGAAPPLTKRGHKRSISLETNAPLTLRCTPSLSSMGGQTALGSPLLQMPSPHGALHTGTLKSRQEQRRLSQKFGSYSNLDDDVVMSGSQMRTKFHNIRQMFELSRTDLDECRTPGGGEEVLQSLPAMLNQPTSQTQNIRRTTPIAAGSRLAISEQQQQQQQPQQQEQQQQQPDENEREQHGNININNSNSNSKNNNNGGNFLRPIAFKPIPFEPDYRIASQQQHQHQQHQQQQQHQQATGQQAVSGERYGYGSTPSLVPLSTSTATHKFGSTTDLRHLAARRRSHRIVQRSINDNSHSLALGLGLGLGLDCLTGHDRPDGASSKGSAIAAGSDLTPSPSDSGISELEAALKDRDSELSYLRQAMEQNEKDKEVFWEHETKRLKLFYESQQREYQLKFKKMEQLLALQQFQLKQHNLRQSEQLQKLQQQLDLTRCSNKSLKNCEQQLQCSNQELNQQLNDAQQTMSSLRVQLEDSEWKVCERNGEIALLKTQLKEAHLEINMKDHAIVSLRHSNNCKTTPCQSQPKQQAEEQQELQQQQQQQQQQQLQQLNKIIALKDQVIGALTNELAKLRKELSDLAIAHEYGEEPCGRYTRLKQQLDNLNEICQKTRKYTQQQAAAATTTTAAMIAAPEQQLDAIMKRLQLDQAEPATQQQTLDTLIEESTTYAEDIAKMREKLDDFRINLELEKRQWCAEKDKVLGYQRQLQAHYIHMYQKLRCLDKAANNATPQAAAATEIISNQS